MVDRIVRTNVTFSYQTKIDNKKHALRYEELVSVYEEETLENHKVVSKAGIKTFTIPGKFATLNASPAKLNRGHCLLEVYFDYTIVYEIASYEALFDPIVDEAEVQSKKQAGALLKLLQNTLLRNFEPDAMQAAEDITAAEKQNICVTELLTLQWSHLRPAELKPEEWTETHDGKRFRIINSEEIIKTLWEISKRNSK
jgi:hypothetical protein